MFAIARPLKGIITVSTLAVCLTAMADLAHAQRQSRAARRPESVTTVTSLDNATRFTREVVNVPVRKSVEWTPPHIYGDTDFSGNGPEVWVRAQFLVHKNAVYCRVYMAAVETRSTLGATFGDNITTVKGWSPLEKVWEPPADKTVVQVQGISESTNLVHEVLRGHRPHLRQSAVGPVRIWADRKGGDTTRYTRVKVDFNYNLPVVVQDDESNIVRVHLPRTVDYTPPHIEGDREFSGNGPWVNITVYMTNSRRQVNFNVFMKARETKADWTTAAGFHSQVIYTAPAGKYIKAVHGKKEWKNLVNYVDDDHDVDDFRDPQLGPIHVIGDTFSPGVGDAGRSSGTGVIFSDIRHSVVVELANE